MLRVDWTTDGTMCEGVREEGGVGSGGVRGVGREGGREIKGIYEKVREVEEKGERKSMTVPVQYQ